MKQPTAMNHTLKIYLEHKIKHLISIGLPDKYLDQWVTLYFKLQENYDN